MDKELSLSIYLNLLSCTGMTLLLENPFLIDRYTRYLSYSYRTRQTLFNDDLKTAQSNLHSQSIWETNATHLVTGIDFGIGVIVVLQCSPQHQSELDALLDKIHGQLKIDNYQLGPEEQNLLSHITKTYIFSNVPQLSNLRTLTDVCTTITRIKFNASHHRPMRYTLKLIRSFFQSPPKGQGHFYALEKEYIDQLDANICQLILVRKSLGR